ncbi:MAG: acetylornithine carbamoyltransferase [Prolixibacteraceae bacterium]|nr:acetylornithine carbamoyltransferase [Prolixibacteraceae bacterium]
MNKFTCVNDLSNLDDALKLAFELKKDPYKYQTLGKNKTMLLVFFNSSLRTRLSTQKAALNLGMNVIVFDINAGGWKLETEMGVIMDGNKPEHIREAVPVIGKYCDIIGVRSFAGLKNREDDYSEKILQQFVDYAGVPVVSLENATRHPLQSFADLITIEEYKTKKRPKVVLSWAPHPKALPQAVPNSFVEWMRKTDYDFVVTNPEGYDLSPSFMGDVKIERDQMKAFKNADFIYAKNWASYSEYGKILSQDKSWTISDRQMAVTNHAKFMHCLPVRRNMIVTDSVIDGPDSLVIQEAGNRLFSAQTALKLILDQLK